MNVKLIFLIGVALIIAGFCVFSVVYYRSEQDNQHDEYIIKHSALKEVPTDVGGLTLTPVDPSIVKGMIFSFRKFPRAERIGLMFVKEDGFERFRDIISREEFQEEYGYVRRDKDDREKREFGYVCINRDFRNHKRSKQKIFRTAGRRCNVCGRPVVLAKSDPEINIKIGTWYLAFVTAYLRENIEGIDKDKLVDYSIGAYLVGLDQVDEAVTDRRGLGPFLEKLIDEKGGREHIERIKKEAARFRPGLAKKVEKAGM